MPVRTYGDWRSHRIHNTVAPDLKHGENFAYHSPQVSIAAGLLLCGEVIAYPTEAVWGLGADPFNQFAVEKILQLKHRRAEKGLILVAASMEQIDFLTQSLAPSELAKLQLSWPGAVTWLIPHRGQIPPWVCGAFDTVAVRISAHPVVKALCQQFAGPIVSTSANPQGLAPARHAYRVRQYFASSVYYVPGQVDINARPSVIRDLQSDRIIRE